MRGRAAAFDATLRGLILILVVGSPLALGTVHAWSLAVFQWLALALGLIWILRALWVQPFGLSRAVPGPPGTKGPRLFGHPLVTTGLGLPVLAFIGLVGVQLLPMPGSLVGFLSPEAASLQAGSLPPGADSGGVDFGATGSFLLEDGPDEVIPRILDGPGDVPGGLSTVASGLRRLSIYPYATFSRLLLLLSLGSIFVVSLHVFRSPRWIRWILRAVVLFGFALALFGIIQRLSWNGKIFWMIPVEASASPFGPFINHNHFASLIAMIMPVAAGMLMDEARGFLSGGRPGSGLSHGHEPMARLLLAAFAVGVMSAAVVLSSSRGAVLALLAALALYGGALMVRGGIGRPEALVAALLILTAVGLSFWLGVGPLAEKLKAIGDVESEPSIFSRLLGYRATMEIIREYPVFGTGLGTFPQAWKHVYPPGTAAVWHEAHNDYLQLLAEAGAAGFVVFLAALGLFARRYLIPGIMGGDGPGGYTLHGVAVGIVAVALHSLVDFPLQIAGCAVTFVVLSAVVVSWRKHTMEMAA